MSSTIYTGMSIRVKGLDPLLRYLGQANPAIQKALKAELKLAAQPVLKRARANASVIQDDGTMRDSLSIAGRRSGAEVVLKSTDPAAGVKEFAHPGAVYVAKRTDPRANARKMPTFPVGVPHRANAPRVMVPAVNDSQGEVLERLERCLEGKLKEVETIG